MTTRTTRTTKDRIAAALDEARARQVALLDPVPDGEQARQVSPLMSPLCWDVAHVGHYEELWLVRALDAGGATDERLDDLYDAFAHPRAERVALDILDPDAARRFAADVRTQALDVLASLDLDAESGDAARDRLLEQGFVYGLVLQHEHQHIETMLATLALMESPPGLHPEPVEATPARTDAEDLPAEVLVPGGPAVLGTDDEPWAYDNERPAHEVRMDPFWIDTTPVTNAAYAAFVAAGGYDDERWWSETGWAWRIEAGLAHPHRWSRVEDGWRRRRFGLDEALPPDEPVQHVCWYEAEAYARWAGKRLPTEAEWERAATGATPRRFPWGDTAPTGEHAQLAIGTEALAPGPVGAHPAGTSPEGVHDLIGGVWEWTASSFGGYPGFEAFPYREYSEVFFGSEHKVLRGGSWATHPIAVRTTFRNWDLPIRRQIFAGFRCARDAC